MNIVLINTLPRLDYWKVTKEPQLGVPMGLLSIGTVLEQHGYDVTIINPIVDRDYQERIREAVGSAKLVGISVMTAGVASGLEIAQIVRSVKPMVPILWGGVHPTLLPEQTLASDLVDYICWGEGEFATLELVNALRDGKSADEIEGLGFKRNGQVVVNKRKSFLDPNALPFLDYGLVDMDKYLYRDLSTLTNLAGVMRVGVLNTGLGCPWSCQFCINTHASQRYRPKSTQRVIEELDRLVEAYDPDVIHIQDDLFFVDKGRAVAFLDHCDEKGYRFKWFTLSRANYFTDAYMNNEFVKRISGKCAWLGVGIESGSGDVRARMMKEVSQEQIDRTVDTLARNHIVTGYAFMLGMPYESKSDLIDTAKAVMDIGARHKEGSVGVQLYRPYPGTKMFDEAVDLGYMVPGSLEEWAVMEDVETGYTTLDASPWVKDKGMVRYLLEALHWSLFQSIASGTNWKGAVFRWLIIALLKVSMSLSLKLRLRFGWWGFTVETVYCRLLRWAYAVVRL